MAQRRHPRQHAGLDQPQGQWRRRNQDIAGLFVDLLFQHVGIERMMQDKRPAAQQPDHQR